MCDTQQWQTMHGLCDSFIRLNNTREHRYKQLKQVKQLSKCKVTHGLYASFKRLAELEEEEVAKMTAQAVVVQEAHRRELEDSASEQQLLKIRFKEPIDFI